MGESEGRIATRACHFQTANWLKVRPDLLDRITSVLIATGISCGSRSTLGGCGAWLDGGSTFCPNDRPLQKAHNDQDQIRSLSLHTAELLIRSHSKARRDVTCNLDLFRPQLFIFGLGLELPPHTEYDSLPRAKYALLLIRPADYVCPPLRLYYPRFPFNLCPDAGSVVCRRIRLNKFMGWCPVVP